MFYSLLLNELSPWISFDVVICWRNVSSALPAAGKCFSLKESFPKDRMRMVTALLRGQDATFFLWNFLLVVVVVLVVVVFAGRLEVGSL